MGKYFGTDGVRGNAETYITEELAYRIGRYLGYDKNKQRKILLGRDTRISGENLDRALVNGLIKSGAIVYDLGITTTPSVSYFVENRDFDFGVMISASHNPYTDNGIKIFAPTGEKVSNDIELLIEDYIDSEDDYLPVAENNSKNSYVYSHAMLNDYLYYVSQKVNIGQRKYKILFDCAHGSACVAAKTLFQDKLNQDCTFINDTYSGKDINFNCGSTHLEMLCSKMRKGKYDIGFAFDGDADRLMAVAPNGEVLDGDIILFLSAITMQKRNVLKNNKIVITSMSNLGLKKALAKYGIGFEEVDVGDKYVQACLKAKGLSLGGEQSGHIIYYDDLNTGCGLLSAAHVLNIMAELDSDANTLFNMMKKYPQLLINVPVNNKKAIIEDEGLKNVCNEVGVALGDEGRLLVRPSGTEQLIRVMVEAKDIQTCTQYCNQVVEYIKSIN